MCRGSEGRAGADGENGQTGALNRRCEGLKGHEGMAPVVEVSRWTDVHERARAKYDGSGVHGSDLRKVGVVRCEDGGVNEIDRKP